MFVSEAGLFRFVLSSVPQTLFVNLQMSRDFWESYLSWARTGIDCTCYSGTS